MTLILQADIVYLNFRLMHIVENPLDLLRPAKQATNFTERKHRAGADYDNADHGRN